MNYCALFLLSLICSQQFVMLPASPGSGPSATNNGDNSSSLSSLGIAFGAGCFVGALTSGGGTYWWIGSESAQKRSAEKDATLLKEVREFVDKLPSAHPLFNSTGHSAHEASRYLQGNRTELNCGIRYQATVKSRLEKVKSYKKALRSIPTKTPEEMDQKMTLIGQLAEWQQILLIHQTHAEHLVEKRERARASLQALSELSNTSRSCLQTSDSDFPRCVKKNYQAVAVQGVQRMPHLAISEIIQQKLEGLRRTKTELMVRSYQDEDALSLLEICAQLEDQLTKKLQLLGNLTEHASEQMALNIILENRRKDLAEQNRQREIANKTQELINDITIKDLRKQQEENASKIKELQQQKENLSSSNKTQQDELKTVKADNEKLSKDIRTLQSQSGGETYAGLVEGLKKDKESLSKDKEALEQQVATLKKDGQSLDLISALTKIKEFEGAPGLAIKKVLEFLKQASAQPSGGTANYVPQAASAGTGTTSNNSGTH